MNISGMNPPEPESDSWSEEAVEDLLRDFFRTEVPPELREPIGREAIGAEASAPHVAGSGKPSAEASRPDNRRWLHVVGSGLAAVCVLVAAAWLVERANRTETADGQRPQNEDRRRSTDDRSTLAGDAAERDRSALDAAGPVESRDTLSPVGHGAADGLGPGGHEINEWDIKVFPIDEPPPTPPGVRGHRSPAIAEPAPHRFE